MKSMERWPKNREHCVRLLALCGEVLSVCEALGIDPVLSGSLAVFLYTQDGELEVHDIDLACHESRFPALISELDRAGLEHEAKSWHVLQVKREELKVEFDSIEIWMKGLSDPPCEFCIGDVPVRAVSRRDLEELYRRGVEATAPGGRTPDFRKHRDISAKYRLLKSSRTH